MPQDKTHANDLETQARRLLSIQKDLNHVFEEKLIRLIKTKIVQTLTNESHAAK